MHHRRAEELMVALTSVIGFISFLVTCLYNLLFHSYHVSLYRIGQHLERFVRAHDDQERDIDAECGLEPKAEVEANHAVYGKTSRETAESG